METYKDTKVFEIPNRVTSYWSEEAKAIIDSWTSYMVTVDQFVEAILENGLTHAKANGGVAWIVDSSQAKGLMTQELLDLSNDTVFPEFAKNGIKYFITIKPENSVFTERTVEKYSAMAGPNGVQLVEVGSVEQAFEWLKLQS